jgi:hypothetical protein
MPRPHWSNWDAIEETEEVLPGIWSVSTASHGGLILSGERQEAMPEALPSGSVASIGGARSPFWRHDPIVGYIHRGSWDGGNAIIDYSVQLQAW